jgi:SAM-dependent methyltransferase
MSGHPAVFRLLIRLLRPFPDFDFGFMKPVRQRAVTLLALRPGARVLDVGCGPGGSLPYLREAVGSAGEVVGVEISRAVATNAERRVARGAVWLGGCLLCLPGAAAMAGRISVPTLRAGQGLEADSEASFGMQGL